MLNLKAKIEKKQASVILQKPSNFLFRKREIKLTELIFLPYYLFEVKVVFSNNLEMRKLVCVDGIEGEYAFIENPKILDNGVRNNENILDLKIDKEKARDIAQRTVKDVILMRMKKGIVISEITTQYLYMLNYPYWIGLYRKKRGVEFDAIDALTGQKQGIRMRPVLLKQVIK